MPEPLWLSAEQILAIHARVIRDFGGAPGIRDRGLLESAAAMPKASFGGRTLHKSIAEMAAAYHFHLCRNHAFVDGNKRVAVAAAEIFLLVNGYELDATDAELEELTLTVATGELSKSRVIARFRKWTKKKGRK